MRITLLPTALGCLVKTADGRDRFMQLESDLARLACAFGMPAKVADDHPAAHTGVIDFLEECAGTWIEDPGYFD
jgi:hypothetical protein